MGSEMCIRDRVEQKQVDVETIVSHHIPLDATAEAFEQQANEATGLIKSMVYPGRVPDGVTLDSYKA